MWICNGSEGCKKNLKHRRKEVAEDVPLGLVLNGKEEGDGRIQGCKFHLQNSSPTQITLDSLWSKEGERGKAKNLCVGIKKGLLEDILHDVDIAAEGFSKNLGQIAKDFQRRLPNWVVG